MKKLAIVSVLCGLLAVCMGSLLAAPAAAIPGDIDGNGSVDAMMDMMYFVNYLFAGGPPPPNPIDADLDGSPGINLGDLLQFIGSFFHGCTYLNYTGASVRVGSQIRFSSDLIYSMVAGLTDTTYLKIIENGGPDLKGMVIPLSFANRPNEVEVDLDSVSFVGSIIPPVWEGWQTLVSIDNVNKTVLVTAYAEQTGQSIPADSTGVVASLHFSKVTDGIPLAMSSTEVPPSHSFMLISAYCANGTPPSERIFSPKVSLALNGDVTCDGKVDVGDVVYTVNYLYKNGPPPCGM